jgi:hypothetical protein
MSSGPRFVICLESKLGPSAKQMEKILFHSIQYFFALFGTIQFNLNIQLIIC